MGSALQLDMDTARTESAVDEELTGSAPAIQELRKQIAKLARSQAPVHICGESGSGKEVVARVLHEHSPRANGPFVAINTAAIPAEGEEGDAAQIIGGRRHQLREPGIGCIGMSTAVVRTA